LGLSEGAVAVAAFAGAAGLVGGSIDLGATIDRRLPFDSLEFAAVALVVVVGLPMAAAAILSWRGGTKANLLAITAGALLVGWIAVEVLIIRSFSWLQPIFLLAGATIAFVGNRGRHLTWGATDDEIRARMPGDEIPVPSVFSATRAINIEAPPESVWPWLNQVGVGRAGFYSYDFLDNRGLPSSKEVLIGLQNVSPGDLAASMTSRPTPLTSFIVASVEFERSLVWAKNDTVWAWMLVPYDHGTRLLVRLRTGPDWRHPVRSLSSAVLLEVGDFPMMHKMLIGIKDRAESLAAKRERYKVLAWDLRRHRHVESLGVQG
jgi:hypothetical protein